MSCLYAIQNLVAGDLERRAKQYGSKTAYVRDHPEKRSTLTGRRL